MVISVLMYVPDITVQKQRFLQCTCCGSVHAHAPRAMAGQVCRSLDRPASRERQAAAPAAGKHVNFVKGTNRAMRRGAKGSHAAVNTLRGQKRRVTAPNLAQLRDFQELPQCKIDFSRLHTELKEYWTREGLNNGTYPDDVELRGEFPALTSIGAWAFHYADPDPRIPVTTIAIAAPRLRFIGTRAFGHHETGTTEQHLSGSSFRSPCHCMAHM